MSGNGAAALPPSNPSPYLTRSRVEYFYLLLIWIHLLQPLVPISFSTQYLLSLKTLEHGYLQTPSFLTDTCKRWCSKWLKTNHFCSYSKSPVVTFWTLPSMSLLRHGSQNDSNYFRIVLPRVHRHRSRQNFSPHSRSHLHKQVLHHNFHWQLVASC